MDHSEKIERRKNPRENANLFSLLSFAYIGRLYKQAYKNDLEDNDLYEVIENCESKKAGDLLEAEWDKEFKKKSPSMTRLMWNRWGWKYVFIGCIDLTWRLIRSSLEPAAVSNLISYFKPGHSDTSKTQACCYAALVLFIQVFHSIYLHNLIIWVQGLAIEIKAAFSSLIYRKSLKLSPAALSDVSVGNIVNLVTKDVHTFRISIWIISDICTGTVEVLLICYLLYSKIGVVSMAGIVVLTLSLPIQAYLCKVVTDLKLKMAEKTDERLQNTQETLNSIKIIKMYTWEDYFYNKINFARCKELSKLFWVFYLKMVIILIGAIFSKAGFYVLLTVYIYLGYATDTSILFYILTNFKNLKSTLGHSIPNRIGKAGEFLSSFKRIAKLLKSEEINPRLKKTEKTANPMIEVTNARVCIDDKLILDNVSFKLSTGLTAVTGNVGSGKSSLLKMLVQDYPLTGGSFVRQGDISYASQDPWLFPSIIKQNILFGEEFNEARYNEVLRVCGLVYDLKLFEDGDETVLCDRGANLSRGQQARVNLARAVYKNCDIYLLDDSLTALDQTVQDYLFEECIQKFLKGKIVLLATQTPAHIKRADNVIIMENGKIKSFTTPDKIQEEFTEIYTPVEAEGEKQNESDSLECDETSKLLGMDETYCKPVYQETQKKGSVDTEVYKEYFLMGGGFLLAFLNLSLGGVTQASESYSDKLLTSWVDKQENVLNIEKNLTFYTNTTDNFTYTNISSTLDLARNERHETFKLYTIMIVASALLDLIKTYALFDFCRRASINLHKTIIKRIINAVMTFFDKNYIGNVLNRFSQDLINVDERLPICINECYRVVFSAGGIILVIGSTNTSFLLYSAVIFIMLVLMRMAYLPAGRSLKRLDASTRSPMIGHLNASLEGLTTIRASKVENILRDEFDRHQNLHTSAHYMSANAIRAFGFFTDLICSTFMLVVFTRFIFLDADTSAGNVGLALTQVMHLGSTVQWGVREWSELENLMTSVERTLAYTKIETERKDGKTIRKWPKYGSIIFENVSMFYNDRSAVLKNLNFVVAAKQKIGVVGRTGAGKSSLIATLFRLYRIEGKILIDGVDTSIVALGFLRKGLAIIPQDPALFSGTIRSNVDPFGEHSDEQVWKALDKAHLTNSVHNLERKVGKNGEGFSVGQKQLVCLARAILSKAKIVVFDEASANLDAETDALLQESINSNFNDCTMLIVAHRLHTVIDCDKIIVMDKGEIKEFDTPANLLRNSNGLFYNMVKKSGLTINKID
ncbi:unnamed protein product [Phyllotreta striolata]|uniref:Uncharacterized protein n=1 Tax=Phyllotreta striolata TaxID=444603 RepID=A0A9N9TJY5_PHYSR|nr:unnamed protein product [Phyllotreta striolata]